QSFWIARAIRTGIAPAASPQIPALTLSVAISTRIAPRSVLTFDMSSCRRARSARTSFWYAGQFPLVPFGSLIVSLAEVLLATTSQDADQFCGVLRGVGESVDLAH